MTSPPSKCTLCRLHESCLRLVNGRGSVPADIMFIGEAPGRSEEVLGVPFVGPAGRILRQAITEAVKRSRAGSLRFFITNSVRCRPPDNREPFTDELNSCLEYLRAEYNRVSPKQVILLGGVAKKAWRKLKIKCPHKELRHPAYVLRRGGKGGPEYLHFMRELEVLFEEMS